MATRLHPHQYGHLIDRAVEVHFGNEVLQGKVTQVVSKPEGRDIKVVFDDPMVYGGIGAGWFLPSQVSLPGQRPVSG